jgi:hypothetical protein
MLVFCTTCKGRAQHIERTLPKNLADNPNAKFVLVDYNSQDHLNQYIQNNHQKELASGQLVVYSYKAPGPFKMAHAKNMAHRLGISEGGDILVNLDADNFTGPGFADYVIKQFETPNIFLWANVVPGMGLRGCSGRIAVSNQAFLCAGGYDEKYETYSPDDKDFNARLTRLGWISREMDLGFLKAINHRDGLRFREYPELRGMIDSSCLQLIESDTTVVNFGNIGCGIVYRNYSEEAIEIKPVPTRIFGIGMHKTATSSLHTALTILGFKSAHWLDAGWAKRIWQEMNEQGRSGTMEQFYAVSDLPIPLLYRKLDNAYPGSKFILTLRSEENWIKSVEKHWTADHNQFRKTWKRDAFTFKIHKALYGQSNFDKEVFLTRYRQHNAEILEYFKDRPGDLLVLDMELADTWRSLCEFVKRPIPAIHYPREFVTQ